MISGYRTNKQKYENSIQYVNNHSNISEELKKDIVAIIQRYRMSVFCMETEEVYELIEKCAKEGSSRPLNIELHIMVGGKSPSKDNYYETSISKDDDDYIYNLD